jgi:capsular polysaccharide biosynthesis protein
VRPEEYFLIIARHWWLVVIAVLVASGIAFIYSETRDPSYQSSVRLMAIAEPPDYWLDNYARNRLPSYRAQIDSHQFVASALERHGSTVSPDHAIGVLSLDHTSDSNVVRIIATDSDPQRAAEIVNALAGAFVEQSRIENAALVDAYQADEPPPFSGVVQLVQLDAPGPPESPIGPRTRLNTAAAAILGLVFGILLTFAVAYFEDVLRKPEDVERFLDLPTIASIPPT